MPLLHDFTARIRSSTDFHPLNELLFLSGTWIDSVTVGKCQHSLIILDLLVMIQALNVKREGIEPSLLTAFHPTTKLSGVLATQGYNPLQL
jgi:hypothetical protein